MNHLRDPHAQLIAGVLLITVLCVFLARRLLRRATRRLHQKAPVGDRRFLGDVTQAAIGPITILAWYYAVYAVLRVALLSEWVPPSARSLEPVLQHFSSLGLFIAFLLFFHRTTLVIDTRLRGVAARTPGKLDDVLFPLLGTALRVLVPILTLFLFLRLWPLSVAAMSVAGKILAIALIAAVTWILRRAVLLVDAAVLGAETLTGTTSLDQRALFTRVRMLRRVALVLISIFAFAAVLMMFEEVRDVGRSILASAGVAGIVLGIAAQRSLGNLLAGVQIAITQPIRLGDQVLVEGDVGNIEEITLTYVVVRVWDQRRIVLPISYFIEKPFQNWTRVTTNMLSPLALRVDFSLPVSELRDFLQREIARSPFWDKQVFGVQVTNADDRSMEVRVLASAPDSGASFNLQCELREKAIEFIRRNHPTCLPKMRHEQRRIQTWDASIALTDGNAPLVAPKPNVPSAEESATASSRR